MTSENQNLPQSNQKLLKVGLVGRPNVGKSSLFNYLTRSRSAVVKDEPGVTRDIKKGLAQWWGKEFHVFDTGGVTEQAEGLFEIVKKQSEEILSSLDVILFVMDGKYGYHHDDHALLQMIKKTGRPYKCIINKVDRPDEAEIITAEFYELGETEFLPISVEHQDGVHELIEWVLEHEDNEILDDEAPQSVRLSIVGKPNVGKSSLVNCILGEEAQVVYDMPGTTVDAVDHDFIYNDRKYTIVDTAGIRRQSKREDGIEFISAVKSYEAIDRSDIVLLVIDGTLGPTKQDSKIIEYLFENHKPAILVLNKSDLAKEQSKTYREDLKASLARQFHFFEDVRFTFTNAKEGHGIPALFKLIEKTWQDLNIRIPTSQLNKFFTETIRKAPAPVYGTKDVKFYYLTQTHQRPPSFIAFANRPEGVSPSYRRFLSKRIKEQWDIMGIPIRIFAMKSGGGGKKFGGDKSV
ncbi:MAG: ribosome biogenesis GTPase Der [Bdellovibrionaceae bacterium]|nr:ribosome biogenesis GTPase Der [Pseudobdellovibrionaceae bacterium]